MQSGRPTFSQRFQYAFDNAMARGAVALIGLLFAASFLIVLTAALIIQVAGIGPEDQSLGGRFYHVLLRTLDPGTVSSDTGKVLYLVILLAVTFAGIFIVSILIGVLTTGIESRLEQLRKGRSLVLEHDHTLILGWSEEVFRIVRELVIDNANERRPRIVILADRDKVEMEDAIREKVGDTRNTRVIVRSGSPIDLTDLPLVNPQGARSIIVLGPEGDDPDAEVIKIVLAITNDPARRPEPYHIVAEIQDPANIAPARLAGGDEVQLVDINDTIARLIAQTSRQPGLSVVYLDLLDFEGHEIYFHRDSATVGRRFGELVGAYEAISVIGLLSDGGAKLNPPMETAVENGDQLIVIAEDDEALTAPPGSAALVDDASIHSPDGRAREPERILLLGWNHRASTVISELDGYASSGSSLTVLTDAPGAREAIERRSAELRNLRVSFREGNPMDRGTLDELRVPDHGRVIVLSPSDRSDPQRSDARTLVTLLHLREIESEAGSDFAIVSEMMDDRNRQLAEATKAEDFIVSDRLISLLLAQMSQSRHLQPVFDDIFDAEGAEIYLKPIEDYVAVGAELSFATLVESARRRGEVAIGYRQTGPADRESAGFGVVVNPPKSQRLTSTAGDRLIVIAED
jgi:voltage-gated potassium channel Kch